MRRHIATAAAIAVLAIVAGCSHTGNPKVATAASGIQARPSSTASSMPSPAADVGDRTVQFQQCMHERGVEIEISANGDISAEVSAGLSKQQADDAMQACRMYRPDGGERSPVPMTPEDLEKLRQFSQCIREHGFPGYPDPDPETGRVDVNSMGAAGDNLKENPQFRQAVQSCVNFMPGPHPSSNGDGGAK